MITDDVIQELWNVKDAIALAHGYDVDCLVDCLEQARLSKSTTCPHAPAEDSLLNEDAAAPQ